MWVLAMVAVARRAGWAAVMSRMKKHICSSLFNITRTMFVMVVLTKRVHAMVRVRVSLGHYATSPDKVARGQLVGRLNR